MSLCPIQRAGNADLKYLRVNISHSKNSSGIAPDFHNLTVSGQTTPGYVVEPIIAFLSESVNFFYINSCFFRKKGDTFMRFRFIYYVFLYLTGGVLANQVQYRKVLSVRILAKMSPRGRAAMIRIAAANQEAAVASDIIPRL